MNWLLYGVKMKITTGMVEQSDPVTPLLTSLLTRLPMTMVAASESLDTQRTKRSWPWSRTEERDTKNLMRGLLRRFAVVLYASGRTDRGTRE